jgi:hypothetical protein
MGINVNMDYSTLFSSISGGASNSTNYLSNLSGMLSDYSSIKNGSYGKLVSAYYKKAADEGDSSVSDKESRTKETNTAKSAAAEKKQYSSIASSAKEVGAAAEKLSDSGSKSIFDKTWQNVTDEDGNESKVFDYDSKKIIDTVSSLVKNYNSMISEATGSSDVTTSTRASYMSKITNSYKSELSSIGITVNDSGKLSLNKDKMKEAGMEAVKNVMGNKSGYAYQLSSSASLVENAATRAASNTKTYSSMGSLNSDYSSILDSFI